MQHQPRNWIFLLLILIGFCLAILLDATPLGGNWESMRQRQSAEMAVAEWVGAILAPFGAYLIFRFFLVSVGNAGFFRWVAYVTIFGSIGLIGGHAIAYSRASAYDLAMSLSQFFTGIGMLQACKHVERRGHRLSHKKPEVDKPHTRAAWFIGSRYFIALVALANCIAAAMVLHATDCPLPIIALGMAVSLLAGAFSAMLVAWFVTKVLAS